MTAPLRTARVFIAACLLIALPVLAASKPVDSRGLKPITLAIPGEALPVALYGESHALVIGVSDYNNGWPKLPGVKTDVEAVAKVLEKQGFDVTKVVNPTGEKLDRAIKHFVSQHGQKKDSRLLIYFAGHGYTLKADADRQLGYLVPVDAPLSERDPNGFIESALSMEAMEGYAKQIRSKHALFVFDACFSGAFFKMRTAPEAIALKTTLPVRQFITSGGADQPVPDVSVFRKEFVAALEGAADLNHDGYVTGSELGSYLEDKVTNYSHQTQTPQYGKIQDRNLDQGDFVFALDALPQPVTPVVKATPPDAPVASDVSLEDIQAESKRRANWQAWQGRMRGTYDKVAAMTDSPDLKAQAWERFLAAYSETNPYNGEADTLREQARQGLEEAKRQVQGLASLVSAKPVRKVGPASTGARASYEPEMVAIPGGNFQMGSPSGEEGRYENEGPLHRVSVEGFSMSKTEITRGQFAAFVKDTGHDAGDQCLTFEGGKYENRSGRNWRNPGYSQDDTHPVVCVNWQDAQAYTQWLARKTGKSYRLATEAEWEYAARAGTDTARYWGESSSQACGYANVADLTAKSQLEGTSGWTFHNCSDGYAHTAPVASFTANAFGLHDMIGNAWEWVEDCYHDNYSGAPTDGSAWTGGSCERRGLRGGSWGDIARVSRAAYRGISGAPVIRFSFIGFRLARTH